jgi:hypothetical protein
VLNKAAGMDMRHYCLLVNMPLRASFRLIIRLFSGTPGAEGLPLSQDSRVRVSPKFEEGQPCQPLGILCLFYF